MRALASAALACVATVAAPAGAQAASLDAPSSVGIGDSFAVVGNGLKPADGYVLTFAAPPLEGGSPSTCGARIGGARDSTHKRTVFSGQVPKFLVCRLPDGTRVGRVRVKPARGYRLSVCVPTNPSLCDGDTFSSRRVRVLRAGRACRRVGFEDNSDNVAARIRAAGVGCRTARALAARSGRATRCLARGSCSFRAKGFRCRGIADRQTILPSLVFRCTRGADRVTFVNT